MFTTQNGDISPQKSREICKWFNIKKYIKKKTVLESKFKTSSFKCF